MTLTIKEVSDRRALSEFIRLPRRLYAGMPGYAPPLDLERRDLLDPGHAPLFERGEVKYWIAWRKNEPVGRISAQIDPIAIVAWNEQIGMFGCLDAVDDGVVVSALIETAAGWLAARGMKRMRGPFTLSINGESGLQIEGQEAPPMILMPWHPAYLARHLVAAGLTPAKDLLAYTHSPSAADEATRKTRQLVADRVSVRNLDRRNFARDAELMRTLFNDAWQTNWGFVPLTKAEMSKLSRSLRPLIYRDSVIFVEKDGEPIAFAFVLPNLFELVRGFNGRLLPLNWLRLGWRLFRRSFRSGRLLLMGVRSDLQFTVLGAVLPAFMIGDLLRTGRKFRIESVEIGWILEDNRRVRTLIEASGATTKKRYRMFERDV
jgi:hypothetical protein